MLGPRLAERRPTQTRAPGKRSSKVVRVRRSRNFCWIANPQRLRWFRRWAAAGMRRATTKPPPRRS